MKTDLIKVSLRQNAIYIPKIDEIVKTNELNSTTLLLVANASKLGFGFSEELLKAINKTNVTVKKDILNYLKEVMGVNKSWTPLVKGWDIPTNTTLKEPIITFFVNLFNLDYGTKLPCGHTIPPNTFPLERYNGCPFCGTPFINDETIFYGQGSKLKVLELWSDEDIERFLVELLTSKTPLDATQIDSLKRLLKYEPLPKVDIEIKETLMVVVDILVENSNSLEATKLFKTPQDILRYLWYKKTGNLLIIKPKTLIQREYGNSQVMNYFRDKRHTKEIENIKNKYKLKYSRKECKMVALWLESVATNQEKACENMHPHRGMWVRFIRALRLAEYSKRKEFKNLKKLLDIFYNQKYNVWQGELDKARLEIDTKKYFSMLKERPSIFARNLFSTTLWFGYEDTLTYFREIVHKIPARLLATISMYAKIYFEGNSRSVKPLGGIKKTIPANPLIEIYDKKEIEKIIKEIENLFLEEMSRRYAKGKQEFSKIYIEEELFNVPLSIGERAITVQDMPSHLMGKVFKTEGNVVRLFMEWGKGLKAQHLDMDLSCQVVYESHIDYCSYSNLTITGCQHSGDIQRIPAQVGTAEYIDIDMDKLEKFGAKSLIFTGNAYTGGELSVNMVIGWMDSKYPMKISKKSGVAYDPSCVTHQVKITQGLDKGLVFGVLDVKNREITWLEMAFNGQITQNLGTNGVEAFLEKLKSRISVGTLLEIKAKALNMQIIEEISENEEENIDIEIYDKEWLFNPAKVSKLLVD